MAMYDSVLSMRIINANGEIVECDRQNNTELFRLACGGFGLFGIITEVRLKIVPNVKITMESVYVDPKDFHELYTKVLDNKDINVKISRINIANFKKIYVYLFSKTNNHETVSTLTDYERGMSKTSKLLYKWVSNLSAFQQFRFSVESFFETPLDWTTTQTDRNLLMYESAKPMYELYNPFIEVDDTFVLQEYFIPHEQFEAFMEKISPIFLRKFKKISLLNITIRYVLKDEFTFLPYAQKDVFAFVLYYRIERSKDGDSELEKVHQLMVEITKELGGTFYLPYRFHYSDEDLQTCYPMIDTFFKMKEKYDPDHLFSNLWYERYGKKYYKTPTPYIAPLKEEIIVKPIELVRTVDLHRKDSYEKVFQSETLKRKFDQFLHYVFNIEQPKMV
jgi:FAD/FMN-containing dehydrogenase